MADEQYKGAKKSLPEIARALNVDALVEGSVLRAGDRVRITAQLIATRPMRFAWVYASMGDADSALKYLGKSYEERDAMLWWLKIIPEFDPVRSDPGFQELLRRMKLPP